MALSVKGDGEEQDSGDQITELKEPVEGLIACGQF